MNRDKQIEEMAEEILQEYTNCYSEVDQEHLEKMLSKFASDVAREIFKELIDNATFIEYADGGRYLRFNAKFFAELKKKYTEGEG